jgi:hypothetical protein
MTPTAQQTRTPTARGPNTACGERITHRKALGYRGPARCEDRGRSAEQSERSELGRQAARKAVRARGKFGGAQRGRGHGVGERPPARPQERCKATADLVQHADREERRALGPQCGDGDREGGRGVDPEPDPVALHDPPASFGRPEGRVDRHREDDVRSRPGRHEVEKQGDDRQIACEEQQRGEKARVHGRNLTEMRAAHPTRCGAAVPKCRTGSSFKSGKESFFTA